MLSVGKHCVRCSYDNFHFFSFQDLPIGSGDGTYQNRRLFKSKNDHASLVPLAGLLKAEDFAGDSIGSRHSSNHKTGGSSTGGSATLPRASYSSMVKQLRHPHDQQYESSPEDADLPRSTPRTTPHDEFSSSDVLNFTSTDDDNSSAARRMRKGGDHHHGQQHLQLEDGSSSLGNYAKDNGQDAIEQLQNLHNHRGEGKKSG